MDSNSNSCELLWAKVEVDADDRSDDGCSKMNKPNWNSENTMKLIYLLEHECKELWDTRHPLYKDKNARQGRHEYLAESFGTTVEEIVRKLHNLRTQLNNELRKIKRRQSEYGDGSVLATSSWEYFDALSFILRQHVIDADPLENVEGVNLALAEFQADEEIEFGARMKAAAAANSPPMPKPVKALRVAASAPPPLPPSAHPMMWPEQPLPRLRPGLNADECQIFGDFVASELRTLRSEGSRRRLKRIIQKAILQIGEEEDGSLTCG